MEMLKMNDAQKEILNLFKYQHSEEELKEIKQLISEYLFKKAIGMADIEGTERGYTNEMIEHWSNEHFRISNNANK
jgi:hypothetical protein